MSDLIETKTEDASAEPSVSLEEVQEMLRQSRSNEERFQRERDEERAARRRVEQERDTASTHAQTEAERRYGAEVQSAESELAAAQADADRAEDAIAAAMEAGDWRAVAKAQRALSEATNRAGQQDARKKWLEANKERFAQPPATRREPADELEKVVPDIFPSEKVWLRDRPAFLTDQRYRQKVFAASALAIAEGHERGSDTYLRHMEETLREGRQQEPQDRQREEAQPRERAQSADLAPSRRSAPGREPSNSRDIFRLNEAEVEAADDLFGNPHNPGYIKDEKERYKHYHAMQERLRASGRI